MFLVSAYKNNDKVAINHRQQQQIHAGGALTCSDMAKTNTSISFSSNVASLGSTNYDHGNSGYGPIGGCDNSNSREMTKVVLTSNEAAWFVESWVVEYAIAYQQSAIVQRLVSSNDCCPATPASSASKQQGRPGLRDGKWNRCRWEWTHVSGEWEQHMARTLEKVALVWKNQSTTAHKNCKTEQKNFIYPFRSKLINFRRQDTQPVTWYWMW